MNKKLNILVWEDVPEDARLIEQALSKNGLAFTTRQVARWQDFVKAIGASSPDVILADYRLSRFNSVEALPAEEQLKTSHAQLRALSARAYARLESEKARLAREIHDDLAQKLTALAIELSLLDSGFDYNGQEFSTPELRAKVKNLYELADGIIKSARQIEARLRPKVLDEFGLAAAIEWQTREFEKDTGIKCQCTAEPEDIILERNFSTEIFRIFQEILSNVAQHANASRVSVRVEEKAGQLCLEVRDNGKGVTREQLSDPQSLGLLGIKERASLLSGTVDIEGAPGNGTLVRVLAPVKRSGE